jgi:hypothetical protein
VTSLGTFYSFGDAGTGSTDAFGALNLSPPIVGVSGGGYYPPSVQAAADAEEGYVYEAGSDEGVLVSDS